MKKQFITVLAITVCTLCAFCATACDKDDDNDGGNGSKGYCYCTGRDSSGRTESDIVYLSEWGARDCNDLRHILAENSLGVTFSCK